MAAVGLGVADAATNFATRQASAFVDDPLGYFIKTSRAIGTGLLISGVAMGTAGYYLKAAATSAMLNERQVIGNIGTIFSNIKTPTFQPAATGTAPLSFSLQGVQNFFGDAWTDVQAAGADVAQIGAAIGTLGEDVGLGLTDIGKAFLAFVTHFPDILWNGIVWGVGGAIADVLNWVFPWPIILGGGLLIASLVATGVRAIWNGAVAPAWREAWGKWTARIQTKVRGSLDRLLRNDRPQAAPSSPEPTPPAAPAPVAAPASPAPPPPEAPEPVLPPPDASPSIPDVRQESDKQREGVSGEDPLPAGWSEAEFQDYLGRAETSRRDLQSAVARASA